MNQPDVKNQILEEIRAAHPGRMWTTADFATLSARDAVHKAVQRLSKSGTLRRIDRGLYDCPGFNSLTKKLTNSSYREVLAALGRWDQIRMLVHEERGELPHDDQRVSHHYYDVERMLTSVIADSAIDDIDLGLDCARYARMLFNSRDLDLAHTTPSGFAIMPSAAIIGPPLKDYEATDGIVFGPLPAFNTLLIEIEHPQNQLNQPRREGAR